MSKINNPITGQGKMLISYNGHNELLKLKPDEMKLIYMHRTKKIEKDLYEDMVIETQLFDGTDVCFSLASANLYYKEMSSQEETWINDETNFADFSDINVDNQQIIIQGSIVIDKKITPDFISHEVFKCILFFINTKDFIELLKKF